MSAGQKWLMLALDILSYEVQHANDGELLSQAADRWIIKHPKTARLCIVSAGVLLTLHVANLVDPNYDVVSTEFWKRIRAPRN